MKKLFLVLGVLFLVSLIASSLFLYLEYNNAKRKSFSEPQAPTAPKAPNIARGSTQQTQEAYDRRQAAYEKAKAGYDQEMISYNQQMLQYQQNIEKRDNDARAYILYMVIIGSLLVLLAFACFVTTAFIKPKEP